MSYTIENLLVLVLLQIVLTSCYRDEDKKNSNSSSKWLEGTTDEKFNTVAEQLRGFDVTMMEVGYRYQELYWAGKDQNFDYADYQVEKIETALKKGFERRPKRQNSAKQFLGYALPEMRTSIKTKDTVAFNRNFKILTSHCNSCHALEKVPFFTVNYPVARQSPIRK